MKPPQTIPSSFWRSPSAAYLLAVVLTVGTLGARVAIDSWLSSPTLILFTIPIILSAYWGGIGPGLLSTLITGFGAAYFILPPLHSFNILAPTHRLNEATLFITGVLISVICELLHRTRRRAEGLLIERIRDEAGLAQLAAIVRSSNDAIVGKNLDGIVTSWNVGAEKMFGYAADEIVGQPIQRLIPAECQVDEKEILDHIKQGEIIRHYDTVRRRKDGTPVDVSVRVSAIKNPDGRIIGASKIIRDITGRKRSEREIIRLNRIYMALSQVNEAIVRTQSREALFDKVCSALVDHGGFRMAWIGMLNHTSRRVDLVGQCGDASHYLEETIIYADERPEGQGPTGTAIREGRTYICNDFHSDPRTRPWQEAAARAGFLSSAVLPIRQAGVICGAITVYADAVGFFQDKEIVLLEEVATDVSFGLDNLAREAARHQAEAALIESEERFRTMANSMSQLAWIARADGFIYWYNQRWYEYTGTTPEQMEGWGWQSVHDPAVLPSVIENWTGAIAAGQTFEMEFPLRGADGRFRAFLTRGVPLKDATGKVVQWFGTNTDVAELKQVEEKIRQLNAGLEQRVRERTAELETANRELESFSYSVSHDLRAPLRAVNGFAKIVLSQYGDQLDAEGRRYLERIHNGGKRMGELIDDLLAFSRLTRQNLNRQLVDSVRLVQAALDETAPQREGRPIELHVGELPACQGDPALLKQVWVNLVSNAIKYTRGRDPAVIEIGCRRKDDENIYQVCDNGAGFDMQYAHKLFGVFQRLHRADEFEGTGVGLAIVQRIVHRHGGRVWAEAVEGRGATFYFTLPGTD